jgi:hypothetical protein
VGFGALFREPDKEFAVAIACFGFVCSIAWTLANRGSRYWSSFWRQRVEDIEGDVLGGSLFRVDDVIVPQRGFWGSRSYSVTRLTMALSDFSVLIWMTLATKAAHASGWSVYSMLFLVTAVAYAVVMILKTSVDRNKPTKR